VFIVGLPLEDPVPNAPPPGEAKFSFFSGDLNMPCHRAGDPGASGCRPGTGDRRRHDSDLETSLIDSTSTYYEPERDFGKKSQVCL